MEFAKSGLEIRWWKNLRLQDLITKLNHCNRMGAI